MKVILIIAGVVVAALLVQFVRYQMLISKVKTVGECIAPGQNNFPFTKTYCKK